MPACDPTFQIGRLRQEDHEFEASPGCTMRLFQKMDKAALPSHLWWWREHSIHELYNRSYSPVFTSTSPITYWLTKCAAILSLSNTDSFLCTGLFTPLMYVLKPCSLQVKLLFRISSCSFCPQQSVLASIWLLRSFNPTCKAHLYYLVDSRKQSHKV